MAAVHYTADLVCDSIFFDGDCAARIAAALNAGDITEAGRLLKDACDTNLTGQADDADRRSEAARAFDAKFGSPLDAFTALIAGVRK